MRKLLLIAALGMLPGTLMAQAKPGPVTVKAWMAPTSDENAPVYLRVVSREPKLDKLIGASTPMADVTILMSGGEHPTRVGSVDLPPGETIALGPRGPHLILMDIDEPLLPGDSFPLTVAFRRAGNIETSVTVRGASMAPTSPRRSPPRRGGEGDPR